MMSSYARNFGSRPSCWCRWTYLLYSRRFSSRGVMGRNRKWVLEDSIQDAMWQTILRGPRPPSVRWEKQRNQSSAAHPANKKDSKIQPRCNRKPVCQKLCQPSLRSNRQSPPGARCSTSQGPTFAGLDQRIGRCRHDREGESGTGHSARAITSRYEWFSSSGRRNSWLPLRRQ